VAAIGSLITGLVGYHVIALLLLVTVSIIAIFFDIIPVLIAAVLSNQEPDYKFVIIEKFLSVENEFSLRAGLLLNSYFFLNGLGQRDEKAFGLDKSDVVVEEVPLVYQPVRKIDLTRNLEKSI
jgi:hypothetical protein